MATEMRAAAAVIRHDNHTPTGSLVERTFTVPANFLLIYNSDASTSASVSFDGVSEFPIPAGASLALEVAKLKSYYTKGAVALKVLVGSES